MWVKDQIGWPADQSPLTLIPEFTWYEAWIAPSQTLLPGPVAQMPDGRMPPADLIGCQNSLGAP